MTEGQILSFFPWPTEKFCDFFHAIDWQIYNMFLWSILCYFPHNKMMKFSIFFLCIWISNFAIFSWPIGEFQVSIPQQNNRLTKFMFFFLCLKEKFCDIYTRPSNEFWEFFAMIDKFADIYPWLIDEFCDIFPWLTDKFPDCLQRLIDEFCDNFQRDWRNLQFFVASD